MTQLMGASADGSAGLAALLEPKFCLVEHISLKCICGTFFKNASKRCQETLNKESFRESTFCSQDIVPRVGLYIQDKARELSQENLTAQPLALFPPIGYFRGAKSLRLHCSEMQSRIIRDST